MERNTSMRTAGHRKSSLACCPSRAVSARAGPVRTEPEGLALAPTAGASRGRPVVTSYRWTLSVSR